MDSDHQAQLEFLFHSSSVFDRKTVLDELAKCPADIAVPILQSFVSSSDFLCRRFAVMGLGNHRTDESFQVLANLLEHEHDDNVLAELADTLFEFGDRAIPLLQNLFERNHNWLTRQTILSVLMESDRQDVLLDVIRQALQDPNQTVRETAILALRSLLKGQYEQEALELLTEFSDA